MAAILSQCVRRFHRSSDHIIGDCDSHLGRLEFLIEPFAHRCGHNLCSFGFATSPGWYLRSDYETSRRPRLENKAVASYYDGPQNLWILHDYCSSSSGMLRSQSFSGRSNGLKLRDEARFDLRQRIFLAFVYRTGRISSLEETPNTCCMENSGTTDESRAIWNCHLKQYSSDATRQFGSQRRWVHEPASRRSIRYSPQCRTRHQQVLLRWLLLGG